MDEAKKKRATDLIASIGAARTNAIGAGMSPDFAMKIGAEAEDVALDVLDLLKRPTEPTEWTRVREIAADLFRLTAEPPSFDAPRELGFGTPCGPAEPSSFPVDPPKPARAPETKKRIAGWTVSGSDFRALPYDRAWVESLIPAFRAEYAEDEAARPRVVLANWLEKRPDVADHRLAKESTDKG